MMNYIPILVELIALLPVLASTWSGDGLYGSLKTNSLPMQLLRGQGEINQRPLVKHTPTETPRRGDILMPKLLKSMNLENVSSSLDLALDEPLGKECYNLSNASFVDCKERSVAPLPAEGLAVSSHEGSVAPLPAEGLAVSSHEGSVAPHSAKGLAVSSHEGSVAPLRADELIVSSEGGNVAPFRAEELAMSSNWRSQHADVGGDAPARAPKQGQADGDGGSEDGTSAEERSAGEAGSTSGRGWGIAVANTTEAADQESVPFRDASNYIEKIFLWTRYYNSAVGYEVLDLDDIETLASSHFVVTSPTIILVHGFLSNGLIDWILAIKDKFIAIVDCNVISVQWSAGTFSGQYYTVTGRVPYVGQGIARLVGQMHILKKVRPDQVYLVGHSLGAHVAGFVGKRNKLDPIGRITGLDPAGLTYDNSHAEVRLDKRDANYVDILHTNGCVTTNKWFDCFGISNSIGHTDFWPNGGKYQPACRSVRRRERQQRRVRRDRHGDAFVGCDHEMAYKYYMESLDYSDSTTLFLARPMTANTGAEQLNTSCGHFPQYMGYHADLQYGGGDYYLATGPTAPYAQSDDTCPSRYSPPRLAITTRWIIGVAAAGLGAGLIVVPLATLLTRRHTVDAVNGDDQQILPGEGEQEGEQEAEQEEGGEAHLTSSLQQV